MQTSTNSKKIEWMNESKIHIIICLPTHKNHNNKKRFTFPYKTLWWYDIDVVVVDDDDDDDVIRLDAKTKKFLVSIFEYDYFDDYIIHRYFLSYLLLIDLRVSLGFWPLCLFVWYEWIMKNGIYFDSKGFWTFKAKKTFLLYPKKPVKIQTNKQM